MTTTRPLYCLTVSPGTHQLVGFASLLGILKSAFRIISGHYHNASNTSLVPLPPSWDRGRQNKMTVTHGPLVSLWCYGHCQLFTGGAAVHFNCYCLSRKVTWQWGRREVHTCMLVPICCCFLEQETAQLYPTI